MEKGSGDNAAFESQERRGSNGTSKSAVDATRRTPTNGHGILLGWWFEKGTPFFRPLLSCKVKETFILQRRLWTCEQVFFAVTQNLEEDNIQSRDLMLFDGHNSILECVQERTKVNAPGMCQPPEMCHSTAHLRASHPLTLLQQHEQRITWPLWPYI